MLFNPSQVMLVEYIVFLQETAILLVDLPQEVVEDQCGMWLLICCISPWKRQIITITTYTGFNPPSMSIFIAQLRFSVDYSDSYICTVLPYLKMTSPVARRQPGESKGVITPQKMLLLVQNLNDSYQSWLSIQGARNCRSSMGKLSLYKW